MNASRHGNLAYSMSDQESVPTFHFMLKCLLYSRLQTGLVSNRDFYDEDVNVYMAHLLQAFINPDYLDRVKPYLSQYDSDVFQKLSGSQDARLKYTIYKTNADFLLVSMGMFDDAEAAMPERRGSSSEKSWLDPAEEAYVGRGRTYYRFAYTSASSSPARTPPSSARPSRSSARAPARPTRSGFRGARARTRLSSSTGIPSD